MSVTVADQTIVFVSCVVCGAVTGMLFDVFRILRKVIPSDALLTFVEDLLFWCAAFAMVFGFALRFNNGEIRWYMLLAVLFGALLYFLTVSKIVLKTAFFLIFILKKMFGFLWKLISKIFKFINKPLILTVNVGKKGAGRLVGIIKTETKLFGKFLKHKKTIRTDNNSDYKGAV